MTDLRMISIMGLAFAAVTGSTFVVGQFYLGRRQLKRRLAAPYQEAAGPASARGGPARSFITEHFGEDQFGIEGPVRAKLRRQLLKAGFFSAEAINYYIFARFCTVVAVPVLVFLLLYFFARDLSWKLQMVAVLISALLGVLLPDAYLSRREGKLVVQYRLLFPDMLDLLVVCVSAGLSIAAAFERVRNEIGKQHYGLSMNLAMMAAEMRAGRSMIEALNSFADRIGLTEAAALVVVLRQSIELGGDVSETLGVYSDEMRDKRLLRAEETANKLTVKMVIPLGAFIFPVVLTIVLLPVIVQLANVMK